MSMSSLGAQLSAISSSTTTNNTTSSGIIRSSSRANNDAIGRGFHHSNKHGHSIQESDVTRRPSILYDNAREAAEVSLITLQENAIAALEQLSNSTTTTTSLWKQNEEFVGILSPHNLNNFERGTSTSAHNSQIDKSIGKLLRMLMTMVAECPPPTISSSTTGNDINSNPILLSCLHIIEYLLRKYDIHSRSSTASQLLQTFLPLQIMYPTSYPQLFSRILCLVDLQNTTPEYMFLRQYAARGAPPVTRRILAKGVASNLDSGLVSVVMNIGKAGMEICLAEGKLSRQQAMQIDGVQQHEDGVHHDKALPVRRGISTLLSFSASILVEALHIQSTSKESTSATGGVSESMVRTIYPLVLSACKSGSGGSDGNYYCPEWKEWGRLLASTLAMICPLSMDVKGSLCDAIVEGLLVATSSSSSGVKGKRAKKKEKNKPFQNVVSSLEKNNVNNNAGSGVAALSIKEVDDANSAIMTLLSVLGAMNGIDKSSSQASEEDEDDSWEYYLPLLPPTKKRKSAIIDYMGCELPLSTYKQLSKADNDTVAIVPMAMGAILKSLRDDDDDDEDGDDNGTEYAIIMERMAPLIASIIMHAFSRLEKEAKKVLSSSSSLSDVKEGMKCKADRDVLLVLRLMKEPSLSQLWKSKSSALVAAVTVQTISSYTKLYQSSLAQNDPKDESTTATIILERYTTILKALSTINSAVHDQGVAYAINTIAKNSSSDDDEGEKNQMSRLAQLLGRDDASSLVLLPSTRSKKNDKKKGSSTTSMEKDAIVISSLLPTRVALENADASVRLDAIARLKSIIENGDEKMDDVDLGHALLRRLVTDDDPAVACAAGEIVASQLKLQSLVGGGGDEDEMQVDGGRSSMMAFTSLVDDLDHLAKEALASLSKWTCIGTDDSWSPVTSSDTENKKKKKGTTPKKLKKTAEVNSPLLSCIHICGSIAKLLLEQVSIEDMNVDNEGDDDSDSIAHLFFQLFLSLGAHVSCGSYTNKGDISPLIDEVSKAASSELLQLFNDDTTCATVSDLITLHSASHKVLKHFFGGQTEEMSLTVPKSHQERFLWVALHSYSELLAKSSSKKSDSSKVSTDILQVTLNLTLCQMRSYTQESKKSISFQWEVQFLCDICKRYLSSLAAGDDLVEKAIMMLASTSSSASFDEIVKPAIETQLKPHGSKNHDNKLGVTNLIYACLQPHASKVGVLRILDIAKGSFRGKSVDSKVARDCIIPTFTLLSHPQREIREHVIGILEQFQSVKKDEMLLNICTKVTDRSSPLRSSLVMDGANTLPQLLGQIGLSSESAVQEFLIESCKSCALKENGAFSNGGCQASAVILSSMEKAGENAFPLSKRWQFAGKELFQAFLKYNQNDELALASLSRVRDCVLSMLKGVLVIEAQAGDDGMSIQISIGPSQSGRRMRSYSIGASDSFTTLEPYPESMLEAILEALSSNTSLRLSKHVVQLVVVRQSWANGVFPKLSSKSRNAVVSALLALRTQDNDELAGSALLGLPLKSSDFLHMLKNVNASQSEMDQSAVVFITDCVRGKLEVLESTSNIYKLSSKLFEQLHLLSSVKNSSASEGDSGGRDYTRISILQTLFAIHSHYKSELSKASLPSEKDGSKLSASKRRRSRSHSDVGTQKSLASQADLLVGLVGGSTSEIHSLNSGRGRALSLSLLTCLCEESPSAVVTSLLPALMSLVGAATDQKALGDALVAIVPAYCTHAPSANLSLFSLIESFVGRIIVPSSENEKMRYSLLDHLVGALKLLPTKESSSDAIASLAACVMALQASNLQKPTVATDADSEMSDVDQESQTRLDIRVLASTTSGIKIAVALSLLQYAEKLMSYICGLSEVSSGESSIGTMKMSISELTTLTLRGSNVEQSITSATFSELSEAQQRSILYLAINLLQCVRDALSTPAARRVVRKSKGDEADLCLRLWNELMQTHSNTLRAQAKLVNSHSMSSMEKRFWNAAPIATSECLEILQNLLPVPHFLASVSSALADDAIDTYIRKKSIRLLADRVAEVNSDSPEASLFLEMVPDLVEQVNVDRSTAADAEGTLALVRRTIVMQQGALIAIESFARSLYPSSETGKLAANAAAVFLPALASVTELLDNTASSWIKANGKDGNVVSSGVVDAECQLLSSSSLCVSTLVTKLKARCLPQLPAIIKPLVTSLKAVNVLLGGSNDEASSSGELLQISILKTLQPIAETLPQFLLPYLPLLFSNDALPSKSLRQGSGEGDHSVKAAVMQVETALATKVQIRQLIPALSQALSKNLRSDGSENWEEACSIINVMNIAVESSQRSDLSPIIGKIFNGLVMAYGYEGDEFSRPEMLRSANKCLLSLVMKLSEAQLRPLYARLREWRGDIEDESSSGRRYAFWSLSAELSKSLRSIFLPCLTSVLTDVIDELEMAVSLLCQRTKKGDGSKRRRVESGGSIEDLDKVKPLQPLLQCLEAALKADAHEGGDWTRGDDNQRYNMILNHIGKLLLAQVPKEIPLLSDLTPKEQVSTSAYQQIVQGVGTLEHGNVVGCLTSLAAAAGNEQLWKPLNFAVLEACGHKRSEVRRAGISCLLSIIETIGEEYMVLFPECLPVLSELLEDDEEIAGMAKECVRQGEELLGESLEDSLR
ncbi:hypothetical protein ACHAXR_012507 [Thalassiosira sp. AJA248-18]